MGSLNQMNDKETVEVKRRRQGSSSGPDSQERADAPSRQQPGGQTPPPSFGGGGGSGSGGARGGKAPRIPLWLLAILVVGIFLCNLLFPGSKDAAPASDTDSQPNNAEVVETAQSEPAAEEAAPAAALDTPAPRPVKPSVPGQTWTVLVYQDADDKILEQDIYVDLNEMERVGSSDRVNIISQMDRFKGAYSGDGDWTGTRRYYIQKDDDLNRVRSEMVDDLGEVNMADGKVLEDFVEWGVKAYPADKYVLILSDHGMGWPGGWSDPDPGGQDPSRAPIVTALDDNLYLMELDETLGAIRSKTGMDQFEIIGMDACLMAHLEVFTALAPHARYAVASQETEPSLGWAYTAFLQDLVDNPDMDGAELSRQIVSTYIDGDQRIVDDRARAEFTRQGSSLGGLFGAANTISAAQLTRQLGRDVTLTAADLSAIPALNQKVNDLAVLLQGEDQSAVAGARNYAQSFTNIFGQGTPAPYIDLGNFVKLLKKQGVSAKASQAADQVTAAIQSVVIASKNGSNKPGATGVSIYFPNSTLYRSAVAGPRSYTMVARRFAEESLWDDVLAYHYNSVPIQPTNRSGIVPGANTPQRVPGLGKIEVSPIELSSKTAAPKKPVTLTADVLGENIGYIYLFVGYYDQASNSINVVDTDYLESPTTRENDGVYYPEWKQNETFTLKLSWEPTVFAIQGGGDRVVSLFNPREYGAAAADTIYTVDGVYQYAQSGENVRAQLYFRDGQLRQVFGYSGQDAAGAPREIIPQPGDTFTITEQWLDLDSSGQVSKASTQQGKTLTFDGEPFTMKEIYAARGPYVIGLIVEDLDGNTRQVYTSLTVN